MERPLAIVAADVPSTRRRSRLRRTLAAAALLPVVFCSEPLPECRRQDTATFDVAGTCGPAGTVTLSYSGATQAWCSGNGCYGYLEAPGANALGLPERGEADGKTESEPRYGGYVLLRGQFALVGPAPVSGTAPAEVVERRCRAFQNDVRSLDHPGTVVVLLLCEGGAPGAACSATLTWRGGP